MSKDFISLAKLGICTMEDALRSYCSSSSVFYPVLPQRVTDGIVKGFKKYWLHEINLEQLREACCLKDINGLYKYFSQWLNSEDLDND